MATYNPNYFNPAMGDTHYYVGSQGDDSNARSYLYKGTGHMVGVADWEPQRTNNFEVVIEGLDSLIPAGGWDTNATDGTASEINLPNLAERIMLSVDSFTAPSLEIAQITTHYGNNSVKWAGKPEFPNTSVTINDYIGIGTEQALAAWFRTAYNFETECVGLARNYKKTAYLIEYDPSGGQARTWRMDGCWLASFDLGEWSQDGNNQRKLKATLVYDRVIPDYISSEVDLLAREKAGTVNRVHQNSAVITERQAQIISNAWATNN